MSTISSGMTWCMIIAYRSMVQYSSNIWFDLLFVTNHERTLYNIERSGSGSAQQVWPRYRIERPMSEGPKALYIPELDQSRQS